MGRIHMLQTIFTSVLKNKKLQSSNKYINCNLNVGLNRCQIFRSIHLNHLLQILEEQQLKERQGTVVVYEGPLKKRVKWVKLFSLSSSMLGFAVLPVVIKDVSQVSVFLGATVGIVSTFFLSTPLLLHWITKRYVTELYFDKQTEMFTAKTYNIASQEKEIKFSATDVTVPDMPGMLTSFLVKDSPLFVDANMVKDPDAYSLMMGYDKPFDFKLESERQEEIKE